MDNLGQLIDLAKMEFRDFMCQRRSKILLILKILGIEFHDQVLVSVLRNPILENHYKRFSAMMMISKIWPRL